jgi:hypothetical protein
LYIYTHLIVCFLHAAFQEIGDTELFRDFRRLLMRFLVTLCGGARDHFEIRNLREPGQDLILDPVGKVRVGFIFAQVFKWQDGDGFFICW